MAGGGAVFTTEWESMMSLNIKDREFAGLKCRVVDALPPDATPGKLIVLCHGFGAPGDDLVGIGAHLIEASEKVAESCRFVFPAAPVDLSPMGLPGGRAWWEINMARLAEINQTRDYSQLTSMEPPGMREASLQLADAVRGIQADSGVDDSSMVLGGFSQGAMISTNLVLTHQFHPALLVAFSGTLLCRSEWSSAAAAHRGCPVLQSHGRQDNVLPYEPAESLRDLLSENGFDVTFRAFEGGHTIPFEPLNDLQQHLEER